MDKDALRKRLTELTTENITDEELDKLVRNMCLARRYHDNTEMLMHTIANAYMMGRVSGLKYVLNGAKRGEC